MFKTIYFYELRHWLKQPSVYIYSAIFFGIAIMIMGENVGIFDDIISTGNVKFQNAPFAIFEKMTYFDNLILFLVPIIVGNAIYRDFKSDMHTVLYTFPMTKSSYLLAKFLSGITISIAICLMIPLGLFAGTLLPGVDVGRLASHDLMAYLQPFWVYILPNILLIGAVVFSLVTLTRNIYSGFVLVLILFFLQNLVGSLLPAIEDKYVAALFDLFGTKTIGYVVQEWTFDDFNSTLIPIQGIILYNRLLRFAVGGILFFMMFRKFSFTQNGYNLSSIFRVIGINFSFKWKEAKQLHTTSSNSSIVPLFFKGGLNIPTVNYNYSFINNLKTTWHLAVSDFRFLMTNRIFLMLLACGIVAVFAQQMQQPQQYGFEILPVTWAMLRIPTLLFSGVINILTFLYAGVLINRTRIAKMNELVDISPIPNWTLLFSKLLALVKMQLVLLSVIIIAGTSTQAFQGYYNFEFGQYLFQLYCINFIGHFIWALASIFIQTIFTNSYLGLFLLILGSMGIMGLPTFGLRDYAFLFNIGTDVIYSDLNGWGDSLLAFYSYKIYWLLLGSFLICLSYLLWIRGLPQSFGERLQIAKSRLNLKLAMLTTVFLISFLTMGFRLYYETNYAHKTIQNDADEKAAFANYNEQYAAYSHLTLPKITAVKVDLDIYPNERRFEAKGEYILVNKSKKPIDTLFIQCGFEEITELKLVANVSGQTAGKSIYKDKNSQSEIFILTKSLQPTDSLRLVFSIKNTPNTWLSINSNVLENGTFIGQDVFPRMGVRTANKPQSPHDSTALANSYMANDADRLDFEATVSTSNDQTAIAPGRLLKQWKKGGRNYFHYKMDVPIKYSFGFNSGRYQVKKEQYKGVDLEIFYHHENTVTQMLDGLKASLDFCSENFSEYQHKQAKIVEFPLTYGSHSTVYGNVIPFSEYRFIADVREGNIDLPFYIAAHELAHQWWGNQVVPANIHGALTVTESLAEYVALQTLKKERGEAAMRKFLKMDLNLYLRQRRSAYTPENPLMYSLSGHSFVHYRKGSIVMCALNDYLGETVLNTALQQFLKDNKFADAPYVTAVELVENIAKVTPDSLQYLIDDWFKTVTLYDNEITNATTKKLRNGNYEIKLNLTISKYRMNGKNEVFKTEDGKTLTAKSTKKGTLKSLPLADYISVYVQNKNGDLIYTKKHRFDEILNELVLEIEEKPSFVGIDFEAFLIDKGKEDYLFRL